MMVIVENMQEYTEWYLEHSSDIGKYEKQLIQVLSIMRVICVCGTPMAIEDIAVNAAREFMSGWNKGLSETDIFTLDEDSNIDFVSEARDNLIEIAARHLNMEIVYVSTEY